MILSGYRKELFRSKCHSEHQSLHCHAHLDQDIRDVLPYLNEELDGDVFIPEPPSLTLKHHGRLITLHARMIAVNALADETEAETVLQWLKGEINRVWQHRREIQPRYHGKERPRILEILKLLPKTNCGRCSQPTCILFAALAAEGAKDAEDCPPLENRNRQALRAYLSRHSLDETETATR